MFRACRRALTDATGRDAGVMTSRRHVVSLHDMTDLLTAIPGMLGFVPERSLVLVAFEPDSARIGASMRFDILLEGPGDKLLSPHLLSVIDHLGAVCEQQGFGDVFAVIVDDRHDGQSAVYRRVFTAVARALGPTSYLCVGVVVPQMIAGARWTVTHATPEHLGDTGVIGDPLISPMAVAQAVIQGRETHASRADLARSLSPRDVEDCSEPTCVVHGDRMDLPDLAPGELLAEAITVIAAFDGTQTCWEREVVRQALAHIHVRDAMMALAVTGLSSRAEQVYTDLVRALDGPERAPAATLLGHLYYVQGHGGMAGTAFEVALASCSDYNLACLLDSALARGMHPRELAGIIDYSYDLADEFGVTLPAPELDWAC